MRRPLLAFLFTATLASAADNPGATQIARWKDNKSCAFVLMFDDSCPSHVKFVIPELKKRDLTGTFYVNPGSGHYAANRETWEKEVPALGMELANHTFTHRGGPTEEAIATEISACNEAIHQATPALPWPRLVSWGQPGGLKPEVWPVSKEKLSQLLGENQLVLRPDFGGRGAMISMKTSAEMLAHLDKAISQGSLECIIFHGVGGDWITTPLPVFIELADGVVARKEKVWLTGHIAAHQYATERDSAKVTLAAKDAKSLRLNLACSADGRFFNQPLTLITEVPKDWAVCDIQQGKDHTEATASNGQLTYPALPGSDPIVITKKK